MAAPKSKDQASSTLSRRLRRAGPVPDIVYGGPAPTSESTETEEEFLKRLKLVGAVGKLRKRLGDFGVSLPGRLSELTAEESLKLSEAVDGIRIEDGAFEAGEIKRAFWQSLEEADAKADESERAERERSKIRGAMMALAEIETASEDFRLALAEGRLSCDELPYVARKKFSEIFRTLDGEGFSDLGQEAELKAQLAAQQEEINRLRSAVPLVDPQVAALEKEVAAMLKEGRAPELYSDRPDRKEKPQDFIKRVYGRYLEKGREAIYLDEIRKLDPKFANVLVVTCHKAGLDVGTLVPRKIDRTNRILEKVGTDRALDISNALTAVRMRKPRE